MENGALKTKIRKRGLFIVDTSLPCYFYYSLFLLNNCCKLSVPVSVSISPNLRATYLESRLDILSISQIKTLSELNCHIQQQKMWQLVKKKWCSCCISGGQLPLWTQSLTIMLLELVMVISSMDNCRCCTPSASTDQATFHLPSGNNKQLHLRCFPAVTPRNHSLFHSVFHNTALLHIKRHIFLSCSDRWEGNSWWDL